MNGGVNLDYSRAGSASGDFETRRSCRCLLQVAGSEADVVLPARPEGEVFRRRTSRARRTGSSTMTRRDRRTPNMLISVQSHFMNSPGSGS